MIKVKDVVFVRFAAPDLDAMERFLTDFGLVVTAREGGALYSRGTDPSPYLHVTEQGDAAFRGVAFEAASAEDLAAAAELVSDVRGTGCVIIKHTNPSGVGVGDAPAAAYERALSCDPVSAFGSIISFNRVT